MKLPRFTLRDLFWLVLVVAMAMGWSLHWYRTRDSRQLELEREMYRREYEALRIQLELKGYEVVQSSIGPFLKQSELP